MYNYHTVHKVTGRTITGTVTIEADENVIYAIWDDLEKINEGVDVYKAFDAPTWNEVKCFGCIHSCPEQRDHMECDTGCLHSASFCDSCYTDAIV